MALDGKILSRAKKRLVDKRQQNEEKYARRLAEVYAVNPKIKAIDREIRETVSKAMQAALNGGQDIDAVISEICDENLHLQSERSYALSSYGFVPDYTDEKYMCEICRDTGYSGTSICSCLMELYRQEQAESLSSLFKLGGETFDSFDLGFYSTTPDPKTMISPRENMEFVYETCVNYARKFGKNLYNLFLSGSTGLGKTFLSACIARVVSDRGFSVVYETASSLFAKFEDDKFSKGIDTEAARDDIQRYLECDLLIIDDLGTEMTTAFVVSVLYDLVNTRLITGKNTIISSNLSPHEVRERYSSPLASRIEGEYQILNFYGRDTRLLKKEL